MTRAPVEARRATPDDLDDLVALWAQAREELGRSTRPQAVLPPDQVRVRLAEAVAGTDTILVIGRCEGVACGYAVLRLAPVLLVDGDTLHIEHLFVLPSARRRGVARAMLVVATSIAERRGAEQVMAGAPPSARDAHRFLARLGFSPLVVRRVVATSVLRRRLAGDEGQRRVLDDLLSRRRSLRARSLRAGWVGRSAPAAGPGDAAPTGDGTAPGDTAPPGNGTAAEDDGGAVPGVPARADGPPCTVAVVDRPVQHIDLSDAADRAEAPGAACPPDPLSVAETPPAPAGHRGRGGRPRGGAQR